MGGWLSKKLNINKISQVLNPATGGWRDLTGATDPLAYDDGDFYPLVFPTLRDRRVFKANPGTSWFIDTTGTGVLQKGPAHTAGTNNGTGPAAMFARGKVVIVGGKGDAPSQGIEIINLNATTPKWQSGGSMQQPRARHSLVVLPDGTVLINGGTTGAKNEAGLAVKSPEIWDPNTKKTTVLAEKPGYPQLYHHTAVLLQDGRILTGGGGAPPVKGAAGYRAEFFIFEPPYLLLGGVRPAITSAPSTLSFGKTFTLETTNPSEIDRVTLVHLPSQTHGHNFGHGFADLVITSRGASSLTVTAPKRTAVLPGPYYLHVLKDGVPSVAQIVLLK
jgi:hypothetical protein